MSRDSMSREAITVFVDQLDGVEWNVAVRRYTVAEVHQGKDRSDIQGEAVGKERYFRAWTNALRAAKKEAQRLLKVGGFATATVLEGRRVVAHYEAR